MKGLYKSNGLVFWEAQEIHLREHLIQFFRTKIENGFLELNRGIRFFRCEAPILTPPIFINSNYTSEDVFVTNDLILRPETTMGSYAFAANALNEIAPPICVWQSGKSFRREQDAPLSRMKLKEFYQLEFQLIYTEDTKADYYEYAKDLVLGAFDSLFLNSNFTRSKVRMIESDRLPSYSLKTYDIEINRKEDDWLELASISKRTDFPEQYRKKNLQVTEIAIGLDRCVASLLRQE